MTLGKSAMSVVAGLAVAALVTAATLDTANAQTAPVALGASSLSTQQGDPLGRPPADRKEGRGKEVIGRLLESAAKAIGITPKDLKSSLKQGKSIAQTAAAHQISRDQLKASMTADIQTRVQTALASGKLTQKQADKIMAGLSARLDKVIDRTGPKH